MHRLDRRMDAQAEGSVIGVILLVGITALLAASVFVAVRILSDGDSADPPPALAFAKDPDDPQVSVVRADPGLDWFEDVVLDGSCVPTLNGGAFPTAPGRPVVAGDVLGCALGQELTVSTAVHQGNALVYQIEF